MTDHDNDDVVKPLTKDEYEGRVKSAALARRFGFGLTTLWTMIYVSAPVIVILSILAFEWGVGSRVITTFWQLGRGLFT